MSTHSDEPRRLEINWVQTAGGALAALSSAVLLSTTGVAGTIIGAALGSVIVTVGNAVYSHYLAASKQRVAAARVAAMQTAARVRGRTPGRSTSTTAEHPVRAPGDAAASAAAAARPGSDDAGADADAAADGGDAGPTVRPGPTWGELARRLQWKRIAAIAAGIFVLAMGVILTFEAISGHAVSSYTGGSDPDGPRTSFGGGSGKDDTEPDKPPTTATSTTPDEPTPTEGETTDEPTQEPTTAPTTTTPPTTSTEPPPETTTEPSG